MIHQDHQSCADKDTSIIKISGGLLGRPGRCGHRDRHTNIMRMMASPSDSVRRLCCHHKLRASYYNDS